ncbi:MAG TPA: M24 family metallopeptidase [candidate division Zixibacteria bacterium]|nr:M24 family metallopeptidase [candidate division Zixibacteria bacterium]
MLIGEEELARMHKRFPYPRFSRAEYERRHRNIRSMMRELGLDCLLIIGGSAAYGRLWFNIRYVTNMMGKAEMANYCFFPKEGDPCLIVRPGHSLAEGMLARTAVREVIVGEPNVLSAIVRTVQERGYDRGRVGIVEYDPFTSIPKNHWDFFTSKLPQAEFVFVTREFIKLRLLKSEEEIAAIERSAELGDIAINAIAEKTKVGMTEGEVFGIAHRAVLEAGGEMGMIQLASAPMDDPDINDQRPRPVDRVIGPRDFINNEVGIFYNGYEAQTGKPMVTGQPTREIEEMFDIALEGYKRLIPTLAPGKSSLDSLAAASFVHEQGYEFYGSFLQGMLGANPRHEPQIGFGRSTNAEDRFLFDDGDKLVYKPGMMFTLQMHLVDKKKTRSLFLADTFVITESGSRNLNKIPPQLIRI